MLGIYINNQTNAYIYEKFAGLCENIADQTSGGLEDKLGDYEYLMHLVESNGVIKNLMEPFYYNDAERAETINSYAGSLFGDIASMDKSISRIRIFFMQNQLPEVSGYFYDVSRVKDLPWYRECIDHLTSGAIAWSIAQKSSGFDIEPPGQGGHDVVSGVLKLYDRQYDNNTGLLEVQVNREDIIKLLDNLDTEGIMPEVTIVNGQGQVLYNSFRELNGSAGDTEQRADWETPDGFIRQMRVLWGDEYYFTSRTIARMKCTIIYSYDVKELKTKGFMDRRLIFIVLFTGTVFLILVSWLLIRLVFVKFKRLIVAVKRIQKGDLESRIGEYESDEVGELARNINIMTGRIKELIKTNVMSKTAEKDAQLKALQAQINPHFLYNALETIKMMAELKDELQISDAVSSLGTIMRYNISSKGCEFVSLQDEITYIRNYISIQGLLHDRIEFMIRIDPLLEPVVKECRTLKMIIQPLVENAIKHGFKGLLSGGYVRVEITGSDGNIDIAVTDNGISIPPDRLKEICKRLQEVSGQEQTAGAVQPSAGIGLQNVQERLVLAFGRAYGIRISSEEGGDTCVSIRIPFILEAESRKESCQERKNSDV